jgi:hypothetical protein
VQHVLFLGHRESGGEHRALDRLVARDPKTHPSQTNQQATISQGQYLHTIIRLTSLSWSEGAPNVWEHRCSVVTRSEEQDDPSFPSVGENVITVLAFSTLPLVHEMRCLL